MKRADPSAGGRDRVRAAVWTTAAALASALVVVGSAAAQDDEVRIETRVLGGGVAMLVGRGGNLGVSYGPDGVFLVDDQLAPLTDRILAALRELHEDPPRFVLNTHWHFDHTGGNENLGRAGALILAHDAVRARMSTDQVMKALDRRVPASPEIARPRVTYGDDVTFHLNGQEIHAFHVPAAHTDGDSVIHFRGADVIHTGDVFLSGGYPFVDLSSGGSFAGLIAALDRILEHAGESTRIIPGHGPLATRADVVTYRAMLADVRGRVEKALAEGKSPEQIATSGLTADLDPKWGQGFMKPELFLRLVSESLSGS